LIDFEFAYKTNSKDTNGKEAEEFIETSGVSGTLPYLAPELLTQKQISFKQDVWALGITIYRLLTESFPYRETHPKDLQIEIKNKKKIELNRKYKQSILIIINYRPWSCSLR
jgi:serine/threonine protein kinase